MRVRLLPLPPFLLALSLGLGCAPSHAQHAIMLQQKMGPAEFNQAGLDKLDPAQLQHLQQWLVDHAAELAALVAASAAASASVAADPKPARGGKGTGRATDSADRSSGRIVVSPVAGHVEGWKIVFGGLPSLYEAGEAAVRRCRGPVLRRGCRCCGRGRR